MIRVLLISLLILASCSTSNEQGTKSKEQRVKTTKSLDCINDDNREVIIRWGTRFKKEGYHKGYYLNTEGEVFKYSTKKNKDTRINNIEKDLLCKILTSTQKEFVKVGALNVPADTTVFIFYERPNGNKLRAMWNPKLLAVGSKGMRNVWSLLEQAYPLNRMLLHKEDR